VLSSFSRLLFQCAPRIVHAHRLSILPPPIHTAKTPLPSHRNEQFRPQRRRLPAGRGLHRVKERLHRAGDRGDDPVPRVRIPRRRSERGRRGTDEEKARRDSEVRSYRQRNSVLAEEKRALRAERDGLRIERDGLRAERDGLREQVRSERMRTLAGYSGFGHTLSPTIEANEWRVELRTKGVPTPAEKMVDKPAEKTVDKAGEEVPPTKGDADSMVDVPL